MSCLNASDGILEATARNGVGSNFIYEWLRNDQLVGSAKRLQNAQAGDYTLRITDEVGCMAETTATLTAPLAVGISGSVNHISCTGSRDGDVLVSASGAFPDRYIPMRGVPAPPGHGSVSSPRGIIRFR
ncbi:MAG: hypothetical protein IPH16_20495 [Haliscomenobacter sp.]|nr:hypothetical protein [Haliscomenobacter sp.]